MSIHSPLSGLRRKEYGDDRDDDVAAAGEQIVGKVAEKLTAFGQDVKAKLAEREATIADLQARMDEMEQKAARRGKNSDPAAGSHLLAKEMRDSAEFQALLEGRTRQASIPVKASSVLAAGKALITTGSGTVGQPNRAPGIYSPGQQRRWVRDLMPGPAATTKSVEFLRETAFNNNAAPQVNEGDRKAESSFTFELVELPCQTIAHWAKASRQALSDSVGLQQFIERRLAYGLNVKLEQQIVLGSGASGELQGLLHEDSFSAYSGTPTSGETAIDVLRRAVGQLQAVYYEPDAILLNPNDWTDLELIKDGEGRYLLGTPSTMAPNGVWSTPVLPSNSVPEGNFIVGAFGQAAELRPREEATILVGFEDQDFTKNLVTVLCELRAVLTVPLPGAIIAGGLDGGDLILPSG